MASRRFFGRWDVEECGHQCVKTPWKANMSGILRDPQGHGTPWAPYYSHTIPIRIPKDMVMISESFGSSLPKGGHIIGSPWNLPCCLTWKPKIGGMSPVETGMFSRSMLRFRGVICSN